MATLTVEGKEYDIETLSDEAKALTNSITVVDNKVAQLQSELAIMQTARNAYVQQLVASLEGAQAPASKPAAKKRTATKAAPKKTTTTRSRKKVDTTES